MGWTSSADRLPTSDEVTPGFSLQVLAVVDDPMLRMDDDQPYVDIAAFWPATKRWTCTHVSRADGTVDDYPVNVTHWMPLPDLPADASPSTSPAVTQDRLCVNCATHRQFMEWEKRRA